MNEEQIVKIIIDELRKLGYSVKKTESSGSVDMQKDSYKTGFYTQKKYIESYTTLPKGKKLITEYDIKQLLRQNPSLKEIVVEKDSILSPLAEDFLSSHGIRIIRR
ncbi:MAG: hypothetical protein NZ928_01490 [Endomicrobia bacterium]|nr:hypothetical protein [Endomicrobiia bacterium]MCX7940491.1 hypothetical protein [Endomicrobiia bacterium]MDW8055118.1 hypothetical protein [Elusimicrobiota bacterium]